MLSRRESIVREGHLGGYFRGGDAATWYPNLWTWLVSKFDIKSVLDVGCGEGQSTKFFSELGCNVLGVDGSTTAISDSLLPGRVLLHDFSKAPLECMSYDLIWSCEFVEHVRQEFVGNVLSALVCANKVLAMTHAFPGQRGHHHVNCQESDYWIREVEAVGFLYMPKETAEAREIAKSDCARRNHFVRSGLLFSRQ